MKKEQLYLMMGCFGQHEEDFILCTGIENPILLIDDNLIHYKEMMNYFDSCHLFDCSIFDLNTIRHFIFNLKDRFEEPTKRFWTQRKFELYQKFLLDHKNCGLYLKLNLFNIKERNLPKEKSVLIKSEQSKFNSS